MTIRALSIPLNHRSSSALAARHWLCACVLLVAALWLASTAAWSAKNYGPGATDTEIKLGQTQPYSGPVSALGTIGHAQLAYFEKINAEGGINGRKMKLISLDDAYSPPKTVEQVRKLVEKDQVLLLFSTLGTPTNSAIHKYVNAKKVPHLFVNAGASKWGDPKHYPWTTAFPPPALYEGRSWPRICSRPHPRRRSASCIRTMISAKMACAA